MSAAQTLGLVAVEAGAALAKALLEGATDEQLIALTMAKAAAYRAATARADSSAKKKFSRLQ